MGATENNHRVSDKPPNSNSQSELILTIVLSLLPWVLPMNPWLACFIWILIAGLSGHLVWSSQWTKDGWSATAKIISCIGIAAFISWQALNALKNDKQQTAPIAPTQHESQTVMKPVKPSEPAPSIQEKVEPAKSVKPIPRKATPPIVKKDIPIKPTETIPIKPRETLAAVLIKKYSELPPTIVAAPDRFIPIWIHRINIVRDDREKRHLRPDLDRLIREIGRPPSSGLTIKEFVDDAVAEATFTLRCLEREGYIQITVTAAQGRWYAIDFPNWEFEFVPERLNEFIEGL